MPQQNNSSTSNPQSGLKPTHLIPDASTESNALQIPEISLPKGGGALKGIDEKFEVNTASGSARVSLPLPLSDGRNEFSPQLGLSYNSSGGNSPFGLGWNLSIPEISRKTDNGLPTYNDDEDTFVLGGMEDLVPYLTKNDSDEWEVVEKVTEDNYAVKRYRPRIEKDFSRIEKITHATHGTYWKVTSGTNIVTIYGRSSSARIAKPNSDHQLFKWLAEFSYDDKGNWIKYDYKEENLENVPIELHESHRHSGRTLITNRYLKRVKYGNRKPYFPNTDLPYDPEDPTELIGSEEEAHFFEMVMDFGEHNEDAPELEQDEELSWNYRPDAFSSYRSGFEIRTNRLCQRILMFHLFDELGETPYLVKSLNLEFSPSNINNSGQAEVSYLKSATQYGYVRREDDTYAKKSRPKISYDYQNLEWNNEIKDVSEESRANAPSGLTDKYQWADLYNEGISGILTEREEGWFYKENLGVSENGELQFTIGKQIAQRPSFSGLNSGSISLQDLDSSGEKQLVFNTEEIRGFFPISADEESQLAIDQFTAFKHIPNIDWNDPHIRFIDLNGDGRPELVLSDESAFIWYQNLGKEGMAEAMYTKKSFDEELGPTIIFADKEQSIFLADFSGDGLTDIVRIRNGEVCYWPNLGFGNFGPKVSMSNAPVFDHPDQYSSIFVKIADVSGTGANDIIYLGKNQFKAFINLSGNSWSDAHEISPFNEISNYGKLSVLDFLGTGTSSIVWSSGLPDQISMKYIDLMSSKKPHVLIGYQNNMGKEVSFEYKSSTYFYLQDKKNGTPWVTKLPFPVQVVSKTIIEDKVSSRRFTTDYTYHHGYYDTREREFRGFGRVDQVDSEHYAEWMRNNESNLLEKTEELYQQPVLTRTWFLNGAFQDQESIRNKYKGERWFEVYNKNYPNAPILITDPELDDIQLSSEVLSLQGDEFREAIRTCKGAIVRQEVFALDAPENPSEEALKLQLKPYMVSIRSCDINLIQPRGENKYASFLPLEREKFNVNYERDESDPRLSQTINLAYDDHGNILESVDIVYGRNSDKADAMFQELSDEVSDFSEDVLSGNNVEMNALQAAFSNNIDSAKDAQKRMHITYTVNEFAKYKEDGSEFDDIDLPNAYRLRVPYQVKIYEILEKSPTGDIFEISDFEDTFSSATEITYNEESGAELTKRLIEHLKTRYFDDELNPLDFGYYSKIGLEYENYQLAFSYGLASEVYQDQTASELEVSDDTASNIIEGAGNYANIESGLWIPSGVTNYKESSLEAVTNVRSRFYAPISFTSPTGSETSVRYDGETFTGVTRNNDGYYLVIQQTLDAVGNKMQIEQFNYRVQSPTRIIDVNANPTSVIYNELGQIKAIAIEGNGVYSDASETTVNVIDAADNLSGFKEYEDDAETANIESYFDSSTSDSTDTETLIASGNSLINQATIRFVYNFDAYQGLGAEPVVASSIVREDFFANNDESELKFKFEYSDGMSNVVMSKEQVEPGEAYFMNEEGEREVKDTGTDLRWIGTGRAILNNKGKEVKKYEPYFSTNFLYDTDPKIVEIGVTPIFYYDAIGRLIRTEYPDGSYSKVEFTSWRQLNYDQNDTVLESDCEWYLRRTNVTHDSYIDDPKELLAANAAALHANTPEHAYFDSLGRPVLTILDNGEDGAGKHKFYATFINLDIEGNALAVTDARGNVLVEHKYDMLGHRIYEKNMDSGARWIMYNVLENPVHRWDSRDHVFTFTYDALDRPETLQVQGGDGVEPLNHIYERFEYGEGQVDEIQNNLRAQAYAHYDMAGKQQNNQFDFKRNLQNGTRIFRSDYKNVANWVDANTNNPAVFDADLSSYVTTNEFNALDQVTRCTTADSSVTQTTYNERGALKSVSVTQTEAAERLLIRNVDYDAKGQRQKIEYADNDGNILTSTVYTYDQNTFRLTHLLTRRGNGELLQDISYVYDPVGNILEVEDKAIPQQFFNNQKIEGKGSYTYDAINRLTIAQGREHAGQAISFAQCDNWNDSVFKKSYSPLDNMSWRNFTQNYSYDPVGNIIRKAHIAVSGNWTRLYEYESQNNRLAQSKVGGQTYNFTHHAEHGFLTSLPHLQVVDWNFKDELSAVATQKICSRKDPETTYYIYDSEGQRVRKVIETTAGGAKKEERVYLHQMEVYLKHVGDDVGLERTTLHVMDDTRRVAMIDTRNDVLDGTDQKTIRFQLSNHLNSANLELNEEGEVISYEEYHPYGTTSYSATNQDVKVAAKRYRYTGMERDEESGLGYHGARYYISWLGRWMKPDPSGLVDGTNLFRYAKDNPLKFNDPSGKIPDNVVGDRMFDRMVNAPQPPPPPPPPLWTDGDGNALTNDQLENVRVFIFHDDDFSEQAMVQYNDMVRLYGAGSVALSNTRSTARFRDAWENMRGTDIARVMIMSHGKNQSINIGGSPAQQFTSTGNGRTNISGSAAPNIQDLPQPIGDITSATLYMYTCHSADTQATAHGSGDHRQGALAGTRQPIAEAFSRTFAFAQVIGTVNAVNYHSFLTDGTLRGASEYMQPYPEDGNWVYYRNGVRSVVSATSGPAASGPIQKAVDSATKGTPLHRTYSPSPMGREYDTLKWLENGIVR